MTPTRKAPGVPRTVFSALAVLATLTLALGSCSKRLTTVDPTYTEPEGRFSPDAQLVVWYDSPVEEFRFRDRNQPPIGPERDPFCPNRIRVDPGDELLGVDEFEAHPRGSINAMILDRTPATAFSPMRRESNGGFRQVLDFPLRPVRKWLDSQWELYAYNDPEPSGFTPATYVARGEIS